MKREVERRDILEHVRAEHRSGVCGCEFLIQGQVEQRDPFPKLLTLSLDECCEPSVLLKLMVIRLLGSD